MKQIFNSYLTALEDRSPIRIISNPVHLLTVTILSIFIAELIITIILSNFGHLPFYGEAMFDAFLLSIIVFPILYFLLLKPFKRHVDERKQVEEERGKLTLELGEALAKVKNLYGLLPTCMSCNKIRDNDGHWHHLEDFIRKHTGGKLDHTICHECVKKLDPDNPKNEKK